MVWAGIMAAMPEILTAAGASAAATGAGYGVRKAGESWQRNRQRRQYQQRRQTNRRNYQRRRRTYQQEDW